MAVSWKVETFDSLSSTMDEVRDRGMAGAGEGLVIVAKSQTDAIGRSGNSWIAPLGNLYFSALLKPENLRDIGQYSFVAAVALADAVKGSLKSEFSYTHKWPNDGLINDRKFAGILLHTGKAKDGSDFLNMGVGINIVSAPEGKISFNEAARSSTSYQEMLNAYLDSLDQNLTIYREEGFSPIRHKWLENAKGLGQAITARLPNETLKGVFSGLDEAGALLLGLANGGQRVIHSGEVFFGNDLQCS